MQKNTTFNSSVYFPLLKESLGGLLVFASIKVIFGVILLSLDSPMDGRFSIGVRVSSVLFNISFSIVSSYYFIKCFHRFEQVKDFTFFVWDDFKQLLLESFRVLSHVTLWSLLLILPGIYKLLQYMFVSIVVLVDGQYKAGKVDALEESKSLAKNKLWVLSLFFILFFAANHGVEYISATSGTVAAIVFEGPMQVLIEFTYMFYLYALYKMAKKNEGQNGIKV